MEQAARVGVLETVGQPGDDPDRGLDRRGAVQELARRLVVIAFLLFEPGRGHRARADPSREQRSEPRGSLALAAAPTRRCKGGPGDAAWSGRQARSRRPDRR